jgi:hypothetical protein
MAVTPKRRGEIEAMLDEICGPKPQIKSILGNATVAPPRPKPVTLVCVNGQIVADATVIVSPSDPNWWRGMAVCRDGEILVRRS